MFKSVKTPKDKPIKGKLVIDGFGEIPFSIWTNKNGGIREIKATWTTKETVMVYERKAKRSFPKEIEVAHEERLGWDRLQGRDPRIVDYKSYMIDDFYKRFLR